MRGIFTALSMKEAETFLIGYTQCFHFTKEIIKDKFPGIR